MLERQTLAVLKSANSHDLATPENDFASNNFVCKFAKRDDITVELDST